MVDNVTTNNSRILGAIPSNELWPQFGIPSFSLSEDIAVECDSSDKLAEAVLDEFGIEWSDESDASDGGDLANLDIKRMDALTVVNMSLIERGAKSSRSFIEPIVNPDGVVEFREVGSYSGEIDDIYYETLTGTYVDSVKGVMVTGGKPLPTFKELNWYPIWGENPTRIYTFQDMLTNCRRQDLIRYATIVFNEPQLSTAYEDRIDNLYEITDENAWDNVIDYVRYINPGPLATKDTTITYTKSATVPIQVGITEPGTNGPNMGRLADKPEFDPDIFDASCWTDTPEVDYTEGIVVDIPAELRYTDIRDVFKDKFIKVSNVYVVGKTYRTSTIGPVNDAASVNDPEIINSKLIITIDDPRTTTTRLEPGKHYAVAYDDPEDENTGKTPYVVFAKDVRKDDTFLYGKDQYFYVTSDCEYATQQNISIDDRQIGTLFPYNKNKGILVQEIWVTVDLETPSIVIYDPDGTNERALEIAKGFEYYLAPIVVTVPPAPVAYVGPSTGGTATLVDQLPQHDNDPTTVEDFTDTDMERYMDEMQGGGMAITWSFLDEDSVEGMADMLYEHFQSDVIETIYTCGPDCNPILGGYGERDGVVNAIRYNYTDSGSYTVSVTEGPRLSGNLTPVDGGPTAKMVENHNASGVIIDMVGDNIHFKVRLDGYGERWGVNMCSSILRKGDVVQCTVHNNPIEA
ncbi:MAG: hypothetical protein PVG39_10235 [Desulfobacteraceae bacterium]|jgi:hypothetical protein